MELQSFVLLFVFYVIKTELCMYMWIFTQLQVFWKTKVYCLIYLDHAEYFSTDEREVRYSAISGFVFLRFFAPAILYPKLFDLTTEQTVSFSPLGFIVYALKFGLCDIDILYLS